MRRTIATGAAAVLMTVALGGSAIAQSESATELDTTAADEVSGQAADLGTGGFVGSDDAVIGELESPEAISRQPVYTGNPWLQMACPGVPLSELGLDESDPMYESA